MLFREQGNIQPIVNQYSDPTSDLEAIVWEFIITFILMFTICGVATDPRAVWSELHLMLASKIFYINDEKMGLQNRSDVFLFFCCVFIFLLTLSLCFTFQQNKDLSGVAIGGAVMFNAMIAG
jgi:glycerol uptake facilitator-like aquaporin